MGKGYFEIGIFHTKKEVNIGTLWRSAYQLGAMGIFTIGRRYRRQGSDTPNTICQIPCRHFLTFEEFEQQRPVGAMLVGIEMGGVSLNRFAHPKQAIYILGAEDHGLPPEIQERCNCIVSLDSVTMPSYNVAIAGSIVMYDRVFGRK